MFGLSEEEMDLYRDLAQDFAITEVAHKVKNSSKFITPLVMKGNKQVPDMEYLQQLLTDIEIIITLTATTMAYDYAHLQSDTELKEADIIQRLHTKYENYVVKQFIKYGIVFSTDIVAEVVGEIILELPYIYISVIQDENFDEEAFLEEKLVAYNDYLNDNFSDTEGEGEYDEDDEDEESALADYDDFEEDA